MSVGITVTTSAIVARELTQVEALHLVSAAEYETKGKRGRLLTLMTALDATGKAPARVKLFGFGANETSKGIFYLSQESAGVCLSNEADQGNDLCIDKDHAALWGDSTAYGWFSLAVDAEGLWADTPRHFTPAEGQPALSGIWWLAEGRDLVESYKFRYISPVFWTEYDAEGREVITEILNFALTNIPATKNRAPLINSRGNEVPMPVEITVTTAENNAQILSAVYALTGETEAEKVKGALAALTQIKTQLTAASVALTAEREAHAASKAKLRELTLDGLIKDGKLPPSMRADCVAMSEEALASTVKFLAGLPTPATQPQVTQPPTNATTPEGLAAQLSKEELAHCKIYQLDPQIFAMTKKTYGRGGIEV